MNRFANKVLKFINSYPYETITVDGKTYLSNRSLIAMCNLLYEQVLKGDEKGRVITKTRIFLQDFMARHTLSRGLLREFDEVFKVKVKK